MQYGRAIIPGLSGLPQIQKFLSIQFKKKFSIFRITFSVPLMDSLSTVVSEIARIYWEWITVPRRTPNWEWITVPRRTQNWYRSER